jgi:carbamoyl-phosphate synthase large subunit
MPVAGRVFLSVKDKDKPGLLEVAQGLEKTGFTIVATRGTAEYLKKRGIAVETVNKVTEGRPHIVDQITDMQIDFVINTVHGAQAQKDSYSIRRTTLIKGIPYFTTISAAKAAVRGISAIKTRPLQVKTIQEYHAS